MDNTQLIERAIAGDKDAFCALYDLYKDKLYRYAYYRLGNREDAEDAVSECILSAWKQIGILRSSAAFQTWIFRILSRCCARRIKLTILDREKTAAAQDFYVGQTQADTVSVEVREALAQLSQSEADIVLLSAVAGLTSEEIAAQVGMTAGGVRSKLSRSLTKMRNYLEG
ncbi:MAG: RNA polymerase sigma factor [Mogibacterium sp.]|nr:RNA polymerase sigma factor [Mogibacterium sp.]